MTAPAPAKIEFKPAVREAVGLWIQLVGGSGSGKTFSALRLASGIAGGQKFAFIDTENRRGLHYADQFNFDYAELRAPFRPAAYADAIKAADEAGYPVIVIDSMSHEWAGDGGVLDWHEEELKDRGGTDNQKMAAWIKPKASHKKLVTTLLQVRAHLIVCFRAEPKIEIVRDGNKTVIQEKHTFTGMNGWVPVSEKNLPFEATCSFMLMPDHPGVGLPIKLQEQHKGIFPQGQLIDEAAGKRLAEWAKGDGAPLFDQRAESIAVIVDLGKQLNAAGDSIKWSGKTTAEYANEMFDVKTGLKDLDTEQLLKLVADLTERLQSLTPADHVEAGLFERPTDEDAEREAIVNE